MKNKHGTKYARCITIGHKDYTFSNSNSVFYIVIYELENQLNKRL